MNDAKTDAKSRIQNRFRKQTGLIIDVPKQGSGNSNDGNTARRCFADPELTASVTGIDVYLITRFSVILQTIVSGCSVDAVKFGEYAFSTAEVYLALYPWYYMPASVHKMLLHGASVIREALIPIGDLSEEAQEAKIIPQIFF
jgi:hypothetical protein